MSINERFTTLADITSETMGKWWVSATALMLIILWTCFCMLTQGSGWWYGQFYNFPLNLVTTVAELFIGFLIAAAENRVERRHDALLESIKAHTSADVETTRKNERDIQEIRADMQTIKGLLAKGVTDGRPS